MIDLSIAPYHFGPDHKLVILGDLGDGYAIKVTQINAKLPDGQGPKLTRLFVAAPDLLAALERALEIASETAWPLTIRETAIIEWQNLARAAIAKARNQ